MFTFSHKSDQFEFKSSRQIDSVGAGKTPIIDQKLDKPDPYEWQLRIPINPEKDNLKKAAYVIKDFLTKNPAYNHIGFYILLLSDDSRKENVMAQWDQNFSYDYKISEREGVDREQRGKEICIDLSYLAKEKRFVLTPAQSKNLILELWKRLQDAGIEGIGYYPITPHADKRVNAESGLFVPFTYQANNGWDERLGILLNPDDYNKNHYPDPLKDVIITHGDLLNKGIAPITPIEQEINIRELNAHCADFLTNVKTRLERIKKAALSQEKKLALDDKDHQLFQDYIQCERVMNFLKKLDIDVDTLKKMINCCYAGMHLLFRKIIHCDREKANTSLINLTVCKTQLQSLLTNDPEEKHQSLYLAIINASNEIEKLQSKGDKAFLAEVADCLIRIKNNPDEISPKERKHLRNLVDNADGHSNIYGKLAGALLVVVGVLAAIAGLPLAGGVIAGGGLFLFYNSRQKGLSKSLQEVEAKLDCKV